VRLEWISILYLLSAIVLLFFTLGSSQAMKAAWVEDILGLTPPIAFLVASRVRNRTPNDRFPYGYHRATAIAYLCASVALLALGGFILYDSVSKLARFEHPPIDLVKPFGDRPIWLGWLMLGALAYSTVPQVILGRLKQPLAKELNDKVLYADAEMNRADWMTGVAAMLGIVGIGLGLWWADAVAAIIISFDIVHDGWTNVRVAVSDLMDSRPTRYDHSEPHPLPGEVEKALGSLPWVRGVRVRMREEGHVFLGEALVIPVDDVNLIPRLEEAAECAGEVDWRVHELVVTPVRSLEEEPGGNVNIQPRPLRFGLHRWARPRR
jgi:cation diffusion facilitator family transporter